MADRSPHRARSRSLVLAESLEWALESRSRSMRVLARTTLTVDAWAVALRGPIGAARRGPRWTPRRVTAASLETSPPVADPGSGTAAWSTSDLLRLAPLRALVGCALALLVLGSLAAINRFPVGSPVAYAGRLAPTHVVLVDPPPSPPPPVAPPTTAAPAIATAAVPTTTSTVVLPKPKPRPAFSLSATAGGVWAALRQCESGGNYQENTGNGFYGAYQFTESTWTGLGYPGRPDQEPPAMQDQGAQRLQARSGWGQCPACSRKLGLS
ncbi:MAG TPA: transglycosylase family protein [Acidimicrobiales bacterium]|nr:transglycosylase family protein [Acidimicrobiales bacterium]